MKKRKIMAMLLTAAVTICSVVGCGSENSSGGGDSEVSSESQDPASATEINFDEEPYEINFQYMVAQEGTNQQKVSEAINELTLKELNMKVNLIPMTWGTYNNQISMMLAANEPLDIFLSFADRFSTYIESQYVVDLSQYKGELKDALEVLGEDAECGYVGDFLVGLGQMKERGYPAGLIVRKDIFDELGYKVEDFNVSPDDYSSYDQITELFASVKEAYPDMICMDGTSIMGLEDLSYMDNLGSDFGVLEDYGQTTTVTNWFESEQWKNFCQIGREWFTKGYLSQDIAVNQDSGELKMKAGNCFSFITKFKPNTNIEKLAQTGYEVEVIPLGSAMKNTNAVNSSMLSIANASEDPQKAAIFLNWAYTSQEFNDLINWGIEGEDWVLTDDGMAAYPDGVDASSVGYHNDFGFVYPNQFAGHAWVGNPSDIWEQYETYNAGLMKSKAYGFSFDSTPVATEESQLIAVRDQYWKDLAFGAVDYDEKIQEFNDALYAAGLQAVIDEKQRQLDEWLAAQ